MPIQWNTIWVLEMSEDASTYHLYTSPEHWAVGKTPVSLRNSSILLSGKNGWSRMTRTRQGPASRIQGCHCEDRAQRASWGRRLLPTGCGGGHTSLHGRASSCSYPANRRQLCSCSLFKNQNWKKKWYNKAKMPDPWVYIMQDWCPFLLLSI